MAAWLARLNGGGPRTKAGFKLLPGGLRNAPTLHHNGLCFRYFPLAVARFLHVFEGEVLAAGVVGGAGQREADKLAQLVVVEMGRKGIELAGFEGRAGSRRVVGAGNGMGQGFFPGPLVGSFGEGLIGLRRGQQVGPPRIITSSISQTAHRNAPEGVAPFSDQVPVSLILRGACHIARDG